jgi:MSHA biogenesis protein MshM
MYLKHFQLEELPFKITPDTGFYFNHINHHEAINVLVVALNEGEGFIKITGEVGTGKTLLSRKLLKLVEKDFVSAYISNPYLTPETLIMALAEELGIRFPRDISQHHLLQLITHKLEEINQSGRRALICLDEAQALPIESLEALRLLTNIETEKQKLIHVVMFGQPELDERLKEPSIRQLKQRITFSYKLRPFEKDSVADYINYRLNIAGYNGAPLFNRGAVNLIHKASQGVPRLINILSHKSLMIAYGKGAHRVSKKFVRLAVRDTESVNHKFYSRLGRMLTGRRVA